MRCQGCGSVNLEGSKFCIECSVPLQPRCPKCGFENLTRAKYCGECGTPLTGTPIAPTAIQTGCMSYRASSLCFRGTISTLPADGDA
jgi:hypothetical protein